MFATVSSYKTRYCNKKCLASFVPVTARVGTPPVPPPHPHPVRTPTLPLHIIMRSAEIGWLLVLATLSLASASANLVGYWPLAGDTPLHDLSTQSKHLYDGGVQFTAESPPAFSCQGTQGSALFKSDSTSWAGVENWTPGISKAFTFEF
eukprot:3385979-Rhodomonas_salina.1